MRVLIINEVLGVTSTGRLCAQLAEQYEEKGYEVKVAYGRLRYVPEKYKKYAIQIGTEWDVKVHAIRTRIFDSHGFGSKTATKRFIDWVDSYKPDIIWIHNVHGYYINIEILFKWLKSHPEIDKKWTLHDCWTITGHCTHFTYVKCDKWKEQCSHCIQKTEYPKSIFKDNSLNNYQKKKELFCNIKNMTIITPSKWLASVVKESYLKEYPVEVINNQVDLSAFKPTDSGVKKQLNIPGRMILGVANVWNERKGYYDFMKLATLIKGYGTVVLVGVSIKQLNHLPKDIIGISHTNNQKELAELYTAADVFLNLTYEDTYPTVNLEAQACGTPCITYRTGGSTENVPENNIVEQGDINGVVNKIKSILQE